MRKIVVCIAAGLLLLCTDAISQTTGIKGTIADTAEHRNLENTVIALLSIRDSTLIKYTRANSSGNFEINPIDTGHYFLMVTHPYFADVFDKVVVETNGVKDIGTLPLYSKIQMLEDVVVKTGAAIRTRGDTTVFTADSFKVSEGANVEELLRKLPGITVDRSGKITAMGETVKNVLVDGEEFFGSDPGIATKNLRADIVKDVEVYNKKSDEATFTGIDDGVRDKTINLKLKEDKKKGYFGRIEVGGGIKDKSEGSQNKFNNGIFLNAFKGKRKIAGYGIMSNTGTLNLGWDDEQKYGAGNNMELTDDGGIIMYGGQRNSSNGIPTNWNAGLHYSNKLNEDKTGINLSYKMSKINAPAYITTNSRNFLPDSTWNTNTRNNSFSSQLQQNINAIIENKFDTANTLKLTLRGNANNTTSNNDMYTESLDTLNRFINRNERHTTNDMDSKNLNATLLWTHKFKKPSRTISINNYLDLTDVNSTNNLYSDLIYYQQGDSTGHSLIDQRTINDNNSVNFNTNINYTEPLFKDAYLQISYGIALNKSTNNRFVNANDGSGNYVNRIDSLSNDFVLNNMANTPGLNFRVTKKKYNFSFGSKIGFNQYEQLNKTLNTTRKYNFTNYYPTANFNYKFKPSESLYMSYYGYSSAPTLDQLQPIPNNNDPLNIYIGNPDLKPSFRNDFYLWYSSYKMLSQRNFYINANYGFTDNAFTQLSRFQDSVRVYQTVNADGISRGSLNMEYGFKLKKSNIRLGISPEFNFSKNAEYLSSGSADPQLNKTTNLRYEFGIYANTSKDEKYDITLRPVINYTTSNATVNKSADAKYWGGGGNLYGTIYFTKTLLLKTDVDAFFQQKDKRFPQNNNYIKWNASISQKFSKNKFEARFAVNDILNQNRGYSRNFDSYSFTESNRIVLQRFFLLSFIWNISNMNGTSTSDNNN